jgi:hypothetical protein
MARDRDNGEGSSHVQFADNVDLSQGGFAYDPDQNSEEKRQVRRGYRNLAKTTEGMYACVLYYYYQSLISWTDPDAVQNADDLSKKVDELNSLFAGGSLWTLSFPSLTQSHLQSRTHKTRH